MEKLLAMSVSTEDGLWRGDRDLDWIVCVSAMNSDVEGILDSLGWSCAGWKWVGAAGRGTIPCKAAGRDVCGEKWGFGCECLCACHRF